VRFQRQRGLTTTALLKTVDLRPKEQGQPETLEYRVFLEDGGGRKVSPWHDVPLRAGDGVFHFIVEIPKESSAKMEVATDEAFTPIKQDTKKGNLRYYP
jgi:inorganic pyrophosphatase